MEYYSVIKRNVQSWGHSSVVEHLHSIHKALGLILSTVENKEGIYYQDVKRLGGILNAYC
jgi:hypothetical protein